MRQAWKRVKANKGSAGIDGLDIEQTGRHLVTEWPKIRDQLLQGKYRPSPVRRVTIPKPDGGERELGIPTVTDRLIQQALLQVLQPILDPTFSEHSYLLGWKAYYGLAQTPKVWRTLDEWLRHRLRAIQLKHWKRGSTIYRELINLGAAEQVATRGAGNSRCWWRNSNGDIKRVLTIAYFDKLGVPRLS